MQEKRICLYHRIMRRENFETAANDLFSMVLNAQKKFPNKPRVLYLDIDGHRNSQGGFDADMLELQKEFGMEFLLQYFTEIHFPLVSVKNTKGQNNDIPEGLVIKNAQNIKDTSLEELYIENYSNTEFMSEKDVYEYLKKVYKFLKKYKDKEITNKEAYDTDDLLLMWYSYVKNIVIELFNAFTQGNLLITTAMTRNLIESYGYISIIKKEKDSDLLQQWFVCSMIDKWKKDGAGRNEELNKLIRNYCKSKGIDFNKIYERYKKGRENSWLESVINKKRITFKDVCEYLGEEKLYNDFRNACSFIHGQDIVSKIMPFTFYTSIYAKFYIMMIYIFKTIYLVYEDELIEEEIRDLYSELVELGENMELFEKNW